MRKVAKLNYQVLPGTTPLKTVFPTTASAIQAGRIQRAAARDLDSYFSNPAKGMRFMAAVSGIQGNPVLPWVYTSAAVQIETTWKLFQSNPLTAPYFDGK